MRSKRSVEAHRENQEPAHAEEGQKRGSLKKVVNQGASTRAASPVGR